ncbi:MAG: chromate transporter [Candidatus Eremiobacteraeota bacterium]|nr:chromate transporter [Candidatus Eremiobacteraeota bacterium]
MAEIALCFAAMALRGFGGVLGHSYDILVVRRQWLSEREFAEVYGIGQLVPGGNIINVAAILGDRWAGLAGATAALAGLTLPSTLIAVALLGLASKLAGEPHVASAERAVVAAAAGIVLASGLRTLRTIREAGRPRLVAARAAIAAFACAIACVPFVGLPIAVIVATPLAFLLERRAAR